MGLGRATIRTPMVNRLALVALAGAIAVMPASSPHWRFSYNSPVLNGDFTDVIALSARDVWAVGGVFPDNALDNRPLIKRWNGSSWTAVELPRRYGNAAIDVVSASSARNVWVFGHYLTRTHRFVFALHWNGSSWSRQGSWTPAGPGAVVSSAVITPRNVWICGTSGTQFGTWHFNGRRWSEVKLPFVITSMSVLSGNDIWATAYPNRNNGITLLVRWRNGHWLMKSTVPDITSIITTNMLALTDHDVWVAGAFEHRSGFEALAMNWSAGKWHRYPFPGSVNELNSIVPDGSGGLWAAFNVSQTVAHFSAGRWRDITLPALSGSRPFVGALAHVPRSGTTYAVGSFGFSYSGTHATILKYSR